MGRELHGEKQSGEELFIDSRMAWYNIYICRRDAGRLGKRNRRGTGYFKNEIAVRDAVNRNLIVRHVE